MAPIKYKPPEKPTVTMQSAMNAMRANSNLLPPTKKDYEAQLNRCPTLYNANDLSDISADLGAFEVKWKRKDFPAAFFKTPKAYQAWRRKMLAILKSLTGVLAEKRGRLRRKDEWFDLKVALGAIPGSTKFSVISISVLADEARRAGLRPADLNGPWLDQLCADANPRRREGIIRAVRSLNKAKGLSQEFDRLMPHILPDPSKVRRLPSQIFPAGVLVQLNTLIAEHCRGEYDEILDEHNGGSSLSTEQGYFSAATKYLGSAIRTGAWSPETSDLASAFEKPVFLAVMRDWIAESNPARSVSDRTKRSYVGQIIPLAVRLGKPVDFMATAMGANKNLKKGREDAKKMPPATRAFCTLVVRNRRKEMLFKSMHLRFMERANGLISGKETVAFKDSRIVQFGMLAAYAAIALWGVPLRIDNLRCLRHRGENPTFILPNGTRDRAHIMLPAEIVKNRQMIKAHISDGPTRALEVIDWYIRVIRPRLPWADRSDYLFPGYEGEIISEHSLRDWVSARTRELGIPMNPHNFRHGLASLYLRDHPGEYGQAARLLCIGEKTVRQHYAWIDQEREMEIVQQKVAHMGGLLRGM